MKKIIHSLTKRILKVIWFSGRINRLEYILSVIVVFGAIPIIREVFNDDPPIYFIGLLYLYFTQGAKRCQDRNINGFWIINPANLIFNFSDKSTDGVNKYGVKPNKIFEEKKAFIEEGFDEENSAFMVDSSQKQNNNEEKEHPKKDMLYGAFLFVGGIVLTVCDIGYIFWGAIVYGGYLFLNGFSKYFFSLTD
ncbi:MAG: DUF805 domain-containing protein [Bacteroidota bacterium]